MIVLIWRGTSKRSQSKTKTFFLFVEHLIMRRYLNMYEFICLSIQMPQTEEEWQQVSQEFNARWQFPNCLGALDGKHIRLQKPANSGSFYINHKVTFSTILMAMVDANYKFLYVDVGCNGRVGDAALFNGCLLSQALERNALSIPLAAKLPNSERVAPYVVIADDAFPMKTYLMKPFGHRGLSNDERIFNYRLSRARRVVENAFGIITSRFRVLKTDILLKTKTVDYIVLAVTALHNWLRSQPRTSAAYMPSGSVDEENTETLLLQQGEWRQDDSNDLTRLSITSGPRYSNEAKNVRNMYRDYFINEGAVPWQYNFV
jgi:hypothetical protein